MKTLFLLLINIIMFTVPATEESSFCEGWEDGYEEGYCYEKYACTPPVTPICPIPRINDTTYKDGYNRGFIKGVKDSR